MAGFGLAEKLGIVCTALAVVFFFIPSFETYYEFCWRWWISKFKEWKKELLG